MIPTFLNVIMISSSPKVVLKIKGDFALNNVVSDLKEKCHNNFDMLKDLTNELYNSFYNNIKKI